MSERNTTIHVWLLKAFFLLWACWVLLEYITWHPYYSEAILDNPYLGLFLKFAGITLLAGGVITYRRRKKKDGTLSIRWRGIFLVLIFYLFTFLTLGDYIASQPRLAEVSAGLRIGYFSGYSLYLLASLFLLVLTAHGLGDLVLGRLPLRYGEERPLLNIALGFSLFGTVLLFVAMAGLLNSYVAWALTILTFVLAARSNIRFASDLLIRPRQVTLRRSWPVGVLLTILFIAAIQFVAGIKAYPLGYDGASVYINQATLISEYGGLPEFSTAFNWAVIMSLGQLLYGTETITILLSHGMGILCLIGIYLVARKWLSWSYALLVAAIPFSSQYFGFHAMADEKTDLAFLFFGLAAVGMIFPQGILKKKPTWMTRAGLDRLPSSWPAWVLAGWLAGYAFGIKYTALFLILSLGVVAFYRSGKELAALGYSLLAVAGFFLLGIYRLAYFPIRGTDALLLGSVLAASSLFLLWRAYRARINELWKPVWLTLGLGLVSLLAYAPWAIRNLALNQEISISSATRAVEAGPELEFVPGSVSDPSGREEGTDRQVERSDRGLPGKSPEEREINRRRALELQAETQYDQAVYEEVIRYLGYEPGLWRYTSVPYDLTTNYNIPDGRYLDLGFLFLLGLPLLLFAVPGRSRAGVRNLILVILLITWVASCYFAMFGGPEGMMDIQAILADRQSRLGQWNGGLSSLYTFLLTPILYLAHWLEPIFKAGSGMSLPWVSVFAIGLFGASYLLFRPRLLQEDKNLSALLFFLGVYLLTWWLFGNGVVWYGFIYWALIPILLVLPLSRPGELLGTAHARFSSYFFGTLITVFIVGGTMLYLTNPIVGGVRDQVFSWQNIDYATNPNASRQTVLNAYNPFFPTAIDIMNSDLDARIYCVNTYLGYHVAQNDRRLLNDMVLSRYEEIVAETGNKEEFFDILKDNGYRYILYDLGTGSVDRTPDKTLTAKCQEFINLLVNSPKAELLVTDNYVLDEENGDKWVRLPNGEKYRGRGDLIGQVISPGSFALFEIK